MAQVSVVNDQLVVKMQGMRKFSLKSEFSVPLSNVKSATVSTEAWNNTPTLIPFGQKEWGTDLYGWYFGGFFVQDNKRVFYDLGRNDKAVVIEFKESGEHHILTPHLKPPAYEDFHKIIIGVDSPEETVKLIEEAIQRT